MNAAREAILGRLRRQLGRGADDRAQIAARLAGKGAPPAPGAGEGCPAERFAAKARAVDATLASVARLADVPGEVARYLASRNLPARAAMAPRGDFQALDWAPLAVEARAPQDGDRVGIARAFAAIAETGTLAMASGPDAPASMNFLPETQIVILARADICAGFEQLWQRLLAAAPTPDRLPATLNLVTGTSRTGDIEQTIQTGVHGPGYLHIAIVEEEPG